MQPRFALTWFGLTTLGAMSLGCPADDGATDEVGGSETGSTETSSTDSGSTETSSTDTGSTDTGSTDTGSTDTDSTDTGSTDTGSTDTTGTDTTDTTDTETTGVGDFALIAAELTNANATLVLTFSDAVAPVDAVDPADFKISYAWTYSVMYKQLYEVSYYIDPNNDFGGTPVAMTAIANGPNPDQISLDLMPGVDPGICTTIQNYIEGANLGVTVDAGLFPHYSPGATPVTSEGGIDLLPIGPEWVEVDSYYLQFDVFHWPNLDPQIPIPCN